MVKPDADRRPVGSRAGTSPGRLRPAANGNGGETPVGTQPPGTVAPPVGAVAPPPVEPPKRRRFFGSVKLDALRLARDADRIAREVVQHLSSTAGAEVEVTLEIQARIPDCASPELVRTVTENCQTLRFDPHGFEES